MHWILISIKYMELWSSAKHKNEKVRLKCADCPSFIICQEVIVVSAVHKTASKNVLCNHKFLYDTFSFSIHSSFLPSYQF